MQAYIRLDERRGRDHGLIVVTQADFVSDPVFFSLQRFSDGKYLASDSLWRSTKENLRACEYHWVNGTMTLVIGPDVVHELEPGTNYRLSVNGSPSIPVTLSRDVLRLLAQRAAQRASFAGGRDDLADGYVAGAAALGAGVPSAAGRSPDHEETDTRAPRGARSGRRSSSWLRVPLLAGATCLVAAGIGYTFWKWGDHNGPLELTPQSVLYSGDVTTVPLEGSGLDAGLGTALDANLQGTPISVPALSTAKTDAYPGADTESHAGAQGTASATSSASAAASSEHMRGDGAEQALSGLPDFGTPAQSPTEEYASDSVPDFGAESPQGPAASSAQVEAGSAATPGAATDRNHLAGRMSAWLGSAAKGHPFHPPVNVGDEGTVSVVPAVNGDESFATMVHDYLQSGGATPAVNVALAKKVRVASASDSDSDTAFMLLRDAAESGNTEAMYMVAQFYDPLCPLPRGHVPVSPAQAAAWYKRAAAGGLLHAFASSDALHAHLRQQAEQGDREAIKALRDW